MSEDKVFRNEVEDLVRNHGLLLERISELEASSASHTEFIKNHVENHMDWDGHQNEKIAELENRLSGSEKITSKTISELEKKGELRGLGMNNLTTAYKEHSKEIAELREKFEEREKHQFMDYEILKNIRKQLTKLDGKKELCLSHPFRDSGGEKVEGGNTSRNVQIQQLNSEEVRNSKPPEPIGERKCSFCGKMFKNHNISHYGNFICKPEEDRPPEPNYPECGWTEDNPHCHHEECVRDATRNEPRENDHPLKWTNVDVDNEVVVKREDLQFLLSFEDMVLEKDYYSEESREEIATELKRIREEYNIE